MLDLDVERSLGRFHLRARLQAGAGVTALFGRSGAGKSMLTHVIAGLLRPDRGRVSVGGETLYDSERGIDVPAHRRRVGYVFQDGRLLPHLTVRHNLLYGRLFRRGDGGFVDLHQVVDLLGLEYLLERRPAHLSGGEKQRVAIGRALLANPRLLLMDEPLAALDVHRKGEILQYVERLRDEVKIPIVYVSHAIEEVVRLADTVVVLSDGEVKAVGPVDEVMGRLDLRPFTGRFEGGAVIEGRVAAQDLDYGLSTVRFPGGELIIANLDALVGEPVRVRIRSRDVVLATAPPSGLSALNVLKGSVTEIRESGGAADVVVKVGEATVVARVTRKALDQLGLAEGREAYAIVKAVALDRHSVGYA